MLNKPEDLTQLMLAARRGDAVAYRHLLERLAPWLRGVVRRSLARMNWDVEEVEDIVQETLIAIHLKRQTWDDRQPLEPWARAIAHHKLIDAMRRRGTRKFVVIEDVADRLAVPAPQGETFGADLARLLATLSDRQRRIVHAISVEGRSTREVADELGSSEVAVRVALHRALKALAAAYRRETP